jgi:hypothetical protein
VLATPDRLFISDSNHHQIVVVTHDGREIDRVGSGRSGKADSSFAEAEFHTPQGLAMIDGRLWVADTENHLLRAVDFDARSVATEAGTGEPCTWKEDGGKATTVALNSPWDIAAHGPILFIAMAGAHQIWMMDVARGILWPYAGSGHEARIDGPIEDAAFAQPSGLAVGPDRMFRGGCGVEHRPRDRVAAGEHGADAGRRRSVRVWRRGREGRRRSSAASARGRSRTVAWRSPTPTTTRSRCSIRRPVR